MWTNQHLLGHEIFYVYDRDGKIQEEHKLPMNLRLTFPSEIRLLFQLCGFKIISESADYSENPIEYPKRIVWVVKKDHETNI
jgi:hypothetical protein